MNLFGDKENTTNFISLMLLLDLFLNHYENFNWIFKLLICKPPKISQNLIYVHKKCSNQIKLHIQIFNEPTTNIFLSEWNDFPSHSEYLSMNQGCRQNMGIGSSWGRGGLKDSKSVTLNMQDFSILDSIKPASKIQNVNNFPEKV